MNITFTWQGKVIGIMPADEADILAIRSLYFRHGISLAEEHLSRLMQVCKTAAERGTQTGQGAQAIPDNAEPMMNYFYSCMEYIAEAMVEIKRDVAAILEDPQHKPGMLNKKKAAAYLDISPRTLERLMSEKAIEYARRNAVVIFKREWLDKFAEDHKVTNARKKS